MGLFSIMRFYSDNIFVFASNDRSPVLDPSQYANETVIFQGIEEKNYVKSVIGNGKWCSQWEKFNLCCVRVSSVGIDKDII